MVQLKIKQGINQPGFSGVVELGSLGLRKHVMNTTNFSRILLCLSVLLPIFFSCCASLPNERVGEFNHRQVEYSLIRNKAVTATLVFENGLDGKMYWWK